MKKILIALDYDPTAEKIAEAGYALAKDMNAQAILLHVLADTQYYMPLEYSPIMGFSGMLPLDMVGPLQPEDLEQAALSFLDASRKHLGDPQIETVVAEGESSASILKIANAKNIDIIVIGSHSRSAFEKIIMGSVTEKLLHDCNIPLFIVPTKKKN